MSYTEQKTAQVYSWLRAMSGGQLTQNQVIAGDAVIKANGLDVFADLIGFKLSTGVSGQLDISENGYKIIRGFEGLELKAYKDTGGVWTIGHGTIKYPNGVAVKQGDTCTKEQAEQYLKNDCKWVDACLDRMVNVQLNQNQFDALASFVYNVGETQFKSSTMLRLINLNDLSGAAAQFDRWVYDNGRRIEGLARRRAAERALFMSKA